jgi:hypothetical protein
MMHQNIEDDTEWDNNTRSNAAEILQILDDALAATVQQVFPGGVPPSRYKRGRHWNSKNRELGNLIRQRAGMMVQIATRRDNGATGAQLNKLLGKIARKQRQIRDNLRLTRDEYWTAVADQLQKAYDDKDMKLYYKLIKEAHGPQLAGTTKGRQSLNGQHMKQKEGNERTRTQVELAARWVEHFTELFNQPGEVGSDIEKFLPAQRPMHEKIKTGLLIWMSCRPQFVT